jgi:hypothetical protein
VLLLLGGSTSFTPKYMDTFLTCSPVTHCRVKLSYIGGTNKHMYEIFGWKMMNTW